MSSGQIFIYTHQGWADLNQAIKVTKCDFFYKCFLICTPKFCIDQAIKVTFLIHFLICNSKFCINYQAIKITKSDFFDF